MKRSLIQLSPSTSVVSLPSQWIRKNKLKKGDELNLEEDENNIIISTSSSKSEKEITIDISKLPYKLMWAYIDAAYMSGYDSIVLLTKDSEQTQFMTKVVRYFPGMLIYEERKNRVHFKDMAENVEKDLDKILSRIFNLSVVLIEDGIEASKEKDWQVLSRIKYRDYNINSYVSYYFRQINKFGFSPLSKTGVTHSYIKVLEMIADKFAALFLGIYDKKISIKSEEKVLVQLFEMYKLFQRIHFNYSQEKLIFIEEKRQNIKENLQKMHVHLKLYITEILELFFDLEELETQLHS